MSRGSALHFRWAHLEEATQVVPLMYASSTDLIDHTFRFGRDAPLPFLELDFRRGKGIFGHARQLVAVSRGGGVLATATVYPSRALPYLTLHTLSSALRQFGPRRFFAVAARSLAVAPLFIKPRAEGLFLANCCVAAGHRGAGVFSALFQQIVQLGREMKLQLVELDVSLSNAHAQRVYERLGFEVIGERPYHGGRSLTGFRRMARSLSI